MSVGSQPMQMKGGGRYCGVYTVCLCPLLAPGWDLVTEVTSGKARDSCHCQACPSKKV